MKRKLSFLSTMMLLMTCLVFNACSDSDDVAGGNLVNVLKNNKWQFEYVDDYNESDYGDYFYTYTYRLYFMDNNVGYHLTVEKEYESGSGYSQESYFNKFTYNVSGNTVEVRFKNGTDTYIYNGGFLALGDDIYTPSAMTQSDRDFVNRKAQEIDDEEETNEIVNNLDDYVSVTSEFVEENLNIKFTINTELSKKYPQKTFEYGVEYGYGNYSYTSNLDMEGKSSKNFTMSVLFDECALYMKSYTELVDKINSGEKLTESEQDLLEDIIYEVEKKVKKFKARIFVVLSDKRYYVYDDFYAYVDWDNLGSINGGPNNDGYDGIIRGHKYVDLGLPSGLKWATCNVGATEPWEYGGYYAWGETEEKNYYSWSTYKWGGRNGGSTFVTKYCTESDSEFFDGKIILELEDDVANVKWGGSWRMPTIDEINELKDKCTWEWTSNNGVYGCKVTGNNGNSIFLPSAGSGDEPYLNVGYYHSSSLSDYDSHITFSLYFNQFGCSERSFYRSGGFCVRPVTSK